jgi:quinol monooxygenase YgiN
MIHVIAYVKMKPGMIPKALDFYRVLLPKVFATEKGCLEYSPTIDFDIGAVNQNKDPNMIVVHERWAAIDDFKAHLTMPHSAEFRASIKDFLEERITVTITQDAL